MVDGKYHVETLESSIELLKIFGSSISEVFANTEVLALRNVGKEGISLTHEEWDMLRAELTHFPAALTRYLFDPSHLVDATLSSSLVDMYKFLNSVLLQDFVIWLLTVGNFGKLRLCNKLIALLQEGDIYVHRMIAAAASELQDRIEAQTVQLCSELWNAVPDLQHLIKQLQAVHQTEVIVNQTALTRIPSWCNTRDGYVDRRIVVQLLMDCSQLQSLNHISSNKRDFEEEMTAVQQAAIKTLVTLFDAENIQFFGLGLGSL